MEKVDIRKYLTFNYFTTFITSLASILFVLSFLFGLDLSKVFTEFQRGMLFGAITLYLSAVILNHFWGNKTNNDKKGVTTINDIIGWGAVALLILVILKVIGVI